MSEQERPRVLCVDDEMRVVEALALHLRREYEVYTALSAEQGLQQLREVRGAAVVISDMRMPGTDGAAFLGEVMRLYPDATRILLTGDMGRDAAVIAVNRGQIFRFLTKPCPPDELKSAVEAGVAQHRLVSTERVLLQKTLIGCIRALVDVLAITSPAAFGRATRVKQLTLELADRLGIGHENWQLEAAAMLSQIGLVSLPAELVDRLLSGTRLTTAEQDLVDAVPEVAGRLLAHIPRIEQVLQILRAASSQDGRAATQDDDSIALGARILTLVLDYDALTAQGHPTDVALQSLRGRETRYGRRLVDQLAAHLGSSAAAFELREIPLLAARPGMTIMQDIFTPTGVLVLPKGFVVTETVIERLRNFAPGILPERAQVQLPAPERPVAH